MTNNFDYSTGLGRCIRCGFEGRLDREIDDEDPDIRFELFYCPRCHRLIGQE